MADFVRLWASRGAVLDELKEVKSTAECDRPRDEAAATLIQSRYRGSVTRADLTVKRGAATQIQRIARGKAARTLADRLAEEKNEKEEAALFNYCATQLQKIMRGYISRRYTHDYYARKAYINGIKEKSETLRQQLRDHLESQVQRDHAVAEEKAKKEFQTVTQGFHHLVSTRSIPGVFNPPYALSPDEIPSAFGVPVETHLRVGVKSFLRTRAGKKSKKKPPPSYAATRESLRSQGVFGSEVQAEREANKTSKLQMVDSRPFTGGGTTKLLDPVATHTPGLSAGTEYQPLWRASRGMRDMLDAPEYKSKRVSDVPFSATLSKSGALFEDIERQRSREAVQRGKRVMMGSR